MSLTTLQQQYVDLLIKQYWEQPRASAEVALYASMFESLRDTIDGMFALLDVDNVGGVHLDRIAALVGVSRVVPFVVIGEAFGFDGLDSARGFADKFDPLRVGGPFARKFQPARTALDLDDASLRAVIRAAVARNTSDSTWPGISEVINAQFNGEAWVTDGLDMSLTLYVGPAIDGDRLRTIYNLGLLPKPAGVRYRSITYAYPGGTFGFDGDPDALGFADKYDGTRVGGYLARKLVDLTVPTAPPSWYRIGNTLDLGAVGRGDIATLTNSLIAFVDRDNDELRTYEWDGTDWAQVGNGLSVASAGNPTMASLSHSTIAFIDSAADELRTYEWDGTDWAQVGNGLPIPVFLPALCGMSATRIALTDWSTDTLCTYEWDGTDWAQVGNALAMGDVAASTLAALSDTEVAYVDSTLDEIRKYAWDGSDWAQVGASLSINVGTPSLAGLSASTVALVDSFQGQLRTYRFAGGAWAQIGEAEDTLSNDLASLCALNDHTVVRFSETVERLFTHEFGYNN